MNQSTPKLFPPNSRHYLPATRPSITHHVEIQGELGEIDLYLTAGYYPDTREIGELFLQVGKQGSTLKGLLDGWAVMMSFALQYGNDLDAIIAKFKDSAFQPAGRTTSSEIPACTSLLDYVVRWMELNRRIPIDENPLNHTQFPATPYFSARYSEEVVEERTIEMRNRL